MKNATVKFTGTPDPEKIREGLRLYALAKKQQTKGGTTK